MSKNGFAITTNYVIQLEMAVPYVKVFMICLVSSIYLPNDLTVIISTCAGLYLISAIILDDG